MSTYYELFLLSPDDYRVVSYGALKDFFGLKLKKTFNQVGSFSFSLRRNLDDFEDLISLPAGQAQIHLIVNGKPYMLGIIQNYSPDVAGFVNVECNEVLQDLIDDVIVGDYSLQNIDYEYIPPRNGMSPDRDLVSFQLPYWDINGPSYWYSYGNLNSSENGAVIDQPMKAGEGKMTAYSYQPDTYILYEGNVMGRANGSSYTDAAGQVSLAGRKAGFPDTAYYQGNLAVGQNLIITFDMEKGTYILGGPPTDLPQTSSLGSFGLTEDSSGISSVEGRGVRIFNKELHYNHQKNYVMKIRSTGDAAFYGSFISDTRDLNPVGIHSKLTPQIQTLSLTDVVGSRSTATIYANYSDGRLKQGVIETELPQFIDELGNKVTGAYALARGHSEIEYHYVQSELYINAWCVYKITYNNQTKTAQSTILGCNVSDFSFADFSQPAVSDSSKVTEQGAIYLGLGGNSKITGVDLDKGVKNTLLQWLQTTSPRVQFIRGDNSSAMDKYVRKLKYSDSARWPIIQKILELAGPVSIQYVGISDNKPKYKVYDYNQLPILPKFVNGDEIFNLTFQRDFADVYNVLTARATYTLGTDQFDLTNNLEVTIKPSQERPNRLGRLKNQIVSSDGIKDITTLTEWAYSIYGEHSKPAEPIDFDTHIDDFWIGAIFGQYLTVHGIVSGSGITEQLNSIGIDSSTGIVSIELAKRLTLRSVLMQSRLEAQKY